MDKWLGTTQEETYHEGWEPVFAVRGDRGYDLPRRRKLTIEEWTNLVSFYLSLSEVERARCRDNVIPVVGFPI